MQNSNSALSLFVWIIKDFGHVGILLLSFFFFVLQHFQQGRTTMKQLVDLKSFNKETWFVGFFSWVLPLNLIIAWTLQLRRLKEQICVWEFIVNYFWVIINNFLLSFKNNTKNQLSKNIQTEKEAINKERLRKTLNLNRIQFTLKSIQIDKKILTVVQDNTKR